MFASRLFPILLSAATLVGAQAGEAEEIAASLSHGQADNALQAADKALAKNPRDARLRLLRGNALAQLGRTTEALQVFTALTADYPNLPEPYNNLAALYAQQGQLDKARTALQMALQTNPAYATAHANLADVYAKLAAQAYEKALQRDVVERQSGQAVPAVNSAAPRLALVQDLVSSSRTPLVASKPATVAQATPATPIAPPPVSKPVEKPAEKPAVPPAVAPTPSTTTTAKPVVTPTPTQVASATPSKPATPVTPQKTATPTPVPPAAKKPAEVEVPASKPAPAKADSGKETESQVARAVNAWAEAWADKRVPAYIASYSKSYKPAGSSRQEWEKQRRERIESAKKISVRLSNLKIKLDGGLATVRFVQSYSSDTTEKSTVKTLILERNGDRWLIREERVG
ncbi:nuclear transport factor 2 family protein [Chitinimonas sp.]|uniref:nuclear transport factor 2 family protein n=1 Tax=Chitinimonas sp. TaxID=1934313 RepID=UPI002F94300E